MRLEKFQKQSKANMTKYQCVVCQEIYDDEEGMPCKCCDKYLRHEVD